MTFKFVSFWREGKAKKLGNILFWVKIDRRKKKNVTETNLIRMYEGISLIFIILPQICREIIIFKVIRLYYFVQNCTSLGGIKEDFLYILHILVCGKFY